MLTAYSHSSPAADWCIRIIASSSQDFYEGWIVEAAQRYSLEDIQQLGYKLRLEKETSTGQYDGASQ